ncbi:hypothetical protein C4573_03710 [Candidatus Woesearchaeota archaeon]|nr:MAG: hypothetical protein C4573_03710 [Candidatus Woesearchaeota archaeon]
MTNITTRKHILYTLTASALDALPYGQNYLELWRGLPDLPFEQAKSRGGYDSLKYAQDGNYIWIAHTAVAALLKDPEHILIAHHKKRKNALHVWWVDIFDKHMQETLEQLIDRAIEGYTT